MSYKNYEENGNGLDLDIELHHVFHILWEVS